MRIGIDLGGHTIFAARFDLSCRGMYEATQTKNLATPEGRGADETFGLIAAAVAELAAGETPERVGLALPSMIDASRRRALKMPNFPAEWDGIDAVDALEAALARAGVRAPVAIENDANCCAIGEAEAGAARGLSDFVLFTMGTGIGCGIFADGHLWRGAHGMAAEGGHVVTGGDEPCGCGGVGHAETSAAADGTERRAAALGLPGDFKALWPMRSDPDAGSVLADTVDAMARVVATAVHLIDPEAVILGGGMSAAPCFVEEIAARTRRYLSAPFRDTLDIRRAALGGKAAALGAALL